MKAKYIMTREVVVGRPDLTVQEAEEVLRRAHISALPVVDDEGRVLGVFSLSDASGKDKRSRIGKLMTAPAITVGGDANLEDVAALMVTNGINHIPVVEDGRLVGIIARDDIIRYVASRHAWPEVESREPEPPVLG